MAMNPEKAAVLYDLGMIVTDDLPSLTAELAEATGRGQYDVEQAVGAVVPRYRSGELSQGLYWDLVAEGLGLLDTDAIATVALNAAEIDQAILGRIRAQSPRLNLGLVSDATPDWVGHFRQRLELDRLFVANVIDSELAEQHDYGQLLKIGANRLQRPPEETWLVDRKPRHLETARQAGLRVIQLGNPDDYATVFQPLKG